MQQQQTSAAFGIDEARRVLGEVFAPWVQMIWGRAVRVVALSALEPKKM